MIINHYKDNVWSYFMLHRNRSSRGHCKLTKSSKT